MIEVTKLRGYEERKKIEDEKIGRFEERGETEEGRI